MLRQESDVDLGAGPLARSSTARRAAAPARPKLHWRRRGARLNLLAVLALTGGASFGGEVLRRLEEIARRILTALVW